MNKNLITILVVNYNTSDFIELMLYAFKKLTCHQYEVLICDNGSNYENLKKLESCVNEYSNTKIFYRKQTQYGSIGHAEALDFLLEKCVTKYTAIMDADCTFLVKNWDEILINKINEKIKIIGTPRQLKNSLDSRTEKIYGDFPTPYAVLLETEVYKKLNVSCLPGNIEKGEDTVWEWKKKYTQADYSYLSFEMKNTRINKDIIFDSIVGCDVYFFNNMLIASHFGRGSTNGKAKYKNWYFRFIPFLSKYLSNKYGKNERKEWIKIARELIG